MVPLAQNIDAAENVGDYFFIEKKGSYKIAPCAGVLVRVIFGSNSRPIVEFYDGENIMCRLDRGNAIGDVTLGIRFSRCLTIKTLSDFDLTVVYIGK